MRHLFAIHLVVDGILPVGGPEGSSLRLASISGGRFEGGRLKGIVLPGGTDWQTLRVDGTILLDARVVLKTDSGALGAMMYTGMRHGAPEIMARLSRSENVDPGSYYFRITANFSTSDADLDWLNHILAIGTGQRHPEGPIYSIYEIS